MQYGMINQLIKANMTDQQYVQWHRHGNDHHNNIIPPYSETLEEPPDQVIRECQLF